MHIFLYSLRHIAFLT